MVVSIFSPHMSPIAFALALLVCSACTSVSSPGAPSPTSEVHRFEDNWVMGGDPERTVTCIPFGDPLTLRGTIVVRPFGKGTDGAVLQVSASEKWILSYRAEGVLLAMDGEQVEVTGRACEKQYQAVFGEHFDLATLVQLPPS